MTERLGAKFCRRVLRPIVGILLRCGLNYREFADMGKSVFVEVAYAEFGIRGRPTNTSRVAMMTGLSRAEVRRQRELSEYPERSGADKVRHAAQVLFGWHMDPDFVDEAGQPRELQIDSEEHSFEALYSRYGSRDVPQTILLKELIKVNAVVRTKDDTLQALSRYYMPSPTDPSALSRSGSVLSGLGETLKFNLYRGPAQASRFEGRAHTPYIPRAKVAEFREFLEQPAQDFLEHVDAWLSTYEQSKAEADLVPLGVGVYQIMSHA